jgi:hypothetical protein
VSGALLLVVGRGGAGKVARGHTTWSLEERLDEAIVSTARAAASVDLPLVMPYDAVSAPLAAQVVAQYARQRDAEGRVFESRTAPRLTFVSAGRDRRRQDGGPDRWHALIAALGVVDPEVRRWERMQVGRELAAAMTLGTGRVLRSFLTMLSRQAPGLPIYAIRSCTQVPAGQEVQFIDDEVRAALMHARGRRKPIEPDQHLGEAILDDVPSDREPPEPYALYAQRMVGRLKDRPPRRRSS